MKAAQCCMRLSWQKKKKKSPVRSIRGIKIFFDMLIYLEDGSGNGNTQCKRRDSIQKLEKLETELMINLDSLAETGTSNSISVTQKQRQNAWRFGRSITGQRQENQQLLCWLGMRQRGKCTHCREIAEGSEWPFGKGKRQSHSSSTLLICIPAVVKITCRGWVLAAQGTLVRSWRLSGAKTTPGNKPEQDKHEGTDAVLPW